MSGPTIGSLFSGVGGLELGLEWGLGGAETRWQVEYEEHARLILAQHWPDATRFKDVRDVGRNNLSPVDLICGGFPCQPHSLAGKRGSSNDERDLWGEFARIIGELRPRWVVAENVPGLLSSADPAYGRGKGGFFLRVLRNLAEMGFDAEWGTFPASAIGAHHKRERVFLVAYSECLRRPATAQRERDAYPAGERQDDQLRDASQDAAALADADSAERGVQLEAGQHERHGHDTGRQETAGRPATSGPDVAHARSAGRQEQHAPALAARAGHGSGGRDALGDSTGAGLPDWAGGEMGQPSPLTQFERPGGREVECRVRYLADGFSSGMGQLRLDGESHAIMGFILALRRVIYANAEETRSRQALLLLRHFAQQETLQWPIGGFERLSEAEILQCPVHGSINGSGGSDEIYVPQAGTRVQSIPMQRLWDESGLTCTSQERGPYEQCTCELDNALRLLSSEMALAERQGGAVEKAKSSLQDLWEACKSEGILPEPLQALAEVWRSITDETLRALLRCPQTGRWAAESVHLVRNRVKRLTRLGNGVVPQQAAVIGRAIAQAEECRRLTGALPERIIRPEHFGGVA